MKKLAFAAAALSALAVTAATVLTTDNVTNSQASAFSDAVSKSAFGQTLNSSLNAVAAHLNAEDAHFVVTNYDSAVHVPEATVEIKVNGNWMTIWKEMTRWNRFCGTGFDWDSWGGFYPWKTNVSETLSEKANRNWGMHDSETGLDVPDNWTQISSSNILLAAGMGYQRKVSTGGGVWVLECNSGTTVIGGSGSYFRVKDGDGNTQFEIIKGNLVELGADAGGITVTRSGSDNLLDIPYHVVGLQPTLKVCTDLAAADWKTEASGAFSGLAGVSVSWTGASGSWEAHLTVPGSNDKFFVKATYMGGSETVINNVAPTKMQSIVIGNTKYAVGYATINGTGVMTLTPQ